MQFNDPGVNAVFNELIERLFKKKEGDLKEGGSVKHFIIPPARVRYLSEITDVIRTYNKETEEQSDLARDLFALDRVKIFWLQPKVKYQKNIRRRNKN